MKLIYGDMGHIIRFDHGYINELVVENKKMFFDMVNDMVMQADGAHGNFLLSIKDKPVELSRYVDISLQFAPFELNRKTLLTKLYSALEQRSMLAENYSKTGNLLIEIEKYVLDLADDFPFEIDCQKLSIGSIIKSISPKIEDGDKSNLEKIFTYMELVRELDRDRLFIMVNMRTYFSDDDMGTFAESAALHGFKVLLLESVIQEKLNYAQRYVVDEDLCEF